MISSLQWHKSAIVNWHDLSVISLTIQDSITNLNYKSFNYIFKMKHISCIIILCLGWISVFAQVPEKAYAKFDFVPGDKIIFEDNFAEESTDEIPSHWVVSSGRVEMTKINGELVMGFLDASPTASPRLSANNKGLSAQRYTIEFDYLWRNNSKSWIQAINEGNVTYDEIQIIFGTENELNARSEALGDFFNPLSIQAQGKVSFKNFEGNYKSGKIAENSTNIYEDLCDKWVHVSIAVTEKSLKVYLNSERVLNAQIESGKPSTFILYAGGSTYEYASQAFFKNFRIAEGGADPYKTLSTDGKFIARGINFDVNKATIKPESMGTLNTIVSMMKEHPELKFEIGGHTDADGDDASNLKLSQERAEAVNAKLIELGIDASRLVAKGYGESKPMANNSTFEGKAQNRRVELLKI